MKAVSSFSGRNFRLYLFETVIVVVFYSASFYERAEVFTDCMQLRYSIFDRDSLHAAWTQFIFRHESVFLSLPLRAFALSLIGRPVAVDRKSSIQKWSNQLTQL